LTNPLSRGEIEHSVDSINSSRAMSFVSGNPDNYSDIDRHDKNLLIDSAAQKEEFIDFEFNSPDEIRIILNKFLKSGRKLFYFFFCLY
jgi:GTP-dependent phosphoenolpyruvate carboxykinase